MTAGAMIGVILAMTAGDQSIPNIASESTASSKRESTGAVRIEIPPKGLHDWNWRHCYVIGGRRTDSFDTSG